MQSQKTAGMGDEVQVVSPGGPRSCSPQGERAEVGAVKRRPVEEAPSEGQGGERGGWDRHAVQQEPRARTWDGHALELVAGF